jgi:hypothetical protein
MRSAGRIATGLALVAGGVGSAQAVDEPLFYELSTGVRYTDNVYLLPEDGQTGTAATLGVILKGRQETGRLQYSADVDLDYLKYVTGHVPSEFLGQLAGLASYAILPENFSWSLDEHFGPVVTDYFLPPSPLNVQNVNVFDTGPDFHFRFSDFLTLRVSGRVGLDDYQRSPLDDERLSVESALEHSLSDVSVVGLGASREVVRYQNSINKPDDFDVNTYFVTYVTHGVRSTLNAQLGYSQTTGGPSQTSGPTGKLTFTRRITSRSTLSFNGGRLVETAGQGSLLQTGIPLSGQPTVNGILNVGPIIASSAGAGWVTQWTRTTASLNVAYEKDTSTSIGFGERDIDNATATITHRLTSRVDASVFAGLSRYDTKGLAPQIQTDTTVGVRAQYRFTGSFLGSLDLSHTNRSIEDGEGFRANVVWIRFGYAPRGVQVPVH